MSDANGAPKPDFTAGIRFQDLQDEVPLAGRAGDDDVILVRRGREAFAVGAHCTHYPGPLADGLVVGDTVRCPWPHACFSLRTGEALRAPSLDAIACYQVERSGDTVFVRGKLPDHPKRQPPAAPASIVIAGGGAAGLAAADMLRREGYDGPLTMISADSDPPVDRPNLSKDYLAGSAKEDWIPLRGPEYYEEQRIDLRLGARVTSLDVTAKRLRLEDGSTTAYDTLLIATGADPVHLTIPGASESQVHYLRSFNDSKAIIAAAGSARSVVVIGASFIGLEVAASLRARSIDVHVVAPDRQPLERVMGTEVGEFVRSLHEGNGVAFHLGTRVDRVDGRKVTLSDGQTVEA